MWIRWAVASNELGHEQHLDSSCLSGTLECHGCPDRHTTALFINSKLVRDRCQTHSQVDIALPFRYSRNSERSIRPHLNEQQAKQPFRPNSNTSTNGACRLPNFDSEVRFPTVCTAQNRTDKSLPHPSMTGSLIDVVACLAAKFRVV